MLSSEKAISKEATPLCCENKDIEAGASGEYTYTLLSEPKDKRTRAGKKTLKYLISSK